MHRRPAAWLLLTLFALGVLLWSSLPAAAQVASTETLADYAIVNGHFFTQTGGDPRLETGYSVTDEAGIPFWSEYQRLGGVGSLGYPVSRRFEWNGYVVQATQRAVLQWRPESGQATFVNVFDELSAAGLDGWLQSFKGIPPPVSTPDEVGRSFEEIAGLRLRLLRDVPQIERAYYAAPDPLLYYGLPTAPAADLGPVVVLRAQRAAFQLWHVPTAFAAPGQVTVVNGGDLAQEAGLLPAAAVAPEPASSTIAAPLGGGERVDEQTVAAMRTAIAAVRPSVVRVSDGSPSHGSGIIINPTGVILTNWHVIANLNRRQLRASLPNGRVLPAQVLGSDEWTDVALIKVDATDLPAASLGDSAALLRGQRVLALGYAPALPGAPSAKTGTVTAVGDRIQTPGDFPLFDLVRTNVFLHPGDSGGALFTLRGEVVGLNTAIRTGGSLQLASLSIPINGAQTIAQQILAEGRVSRPWLGVVLAQITPGLAPGSNLPVARGLLIREVVPQSPADGAGLAPGDVVIAVDGRSIADIGGLRRELVEHKVGDTIQLTVVSAQGARRTVAVKLAERPPDL